MRPGRLTPENDGIAAYDSAPITSFNEAGAINPGKPSLGGRSRPDSPASMRPGRLTPENFSGVAAVDQIADASMRPGRLTPENVARLENVHRRA